MPLSIRVIHVVSVALGALTLAACGPKPQMTRPTSKEPRAYVVFLDGTANDFNSETNLSKLRHRMAWQPSDNVGTFYVEGVGAGNKVIGMATGWGTRHRVQQAYRYLLRNYSSDDTIHLFGFSRGAYASRILASLLHYAGLPDAPLEAEQAERVAARVYAAYKGKMTHQERVDSVGDAIEKLDLGVALRPRRVRFMGLWDTVAAMGTLDRTQRDAVLPNPLYADQLCNVDKAMHALSLDDNRAEEFTPILLTRRHLVEHCFTDAAGQARVPTEREVAQMLDRVVEEVWFPGAHSDVGGGYREGRLDGLSLNWMLPKLRALKLVSNADPVLAHPLDCVHNAERFMGGYVYKERPRDVRDYATGAIYNDGKLRVHASVLQRLSALPPSDQQPGAASERKWGGASPLGLERAFAQCFAPTRGAGLRFTPEAPGCLLELDDPALSQTSLWSGDASSRITCDQLEAPPL